MRKKLILYLFLALATVPFTGSGLEIPGKAVGTVSPSSGAIYYSPPMTGIEDATRDLCSGGDIYTFTYTFNMSGMPDRSNESVFLLIYNPETKRWVRVGEQPDDGGDTVKFEVNFGELYNRDNFGGEPYWYSPFLGTSRFKLVGEVEEKGRSGGPGVAIEKSNRPNVGFRRSLSDEVFGPEIIANFRNPQWKKDDLGDNYTYSVEVRSTEPLDLAILGTRDATNWEVYGENTRVAQSYNWKKVTWKGAPRFSKLEFVIDRCS
jgi:hypothetical protein